MKKVLSVIAILIAILTVYFCFFDQDSDAKDDPKGIEQKIEQKSELYPVYNRLSAEEKRVYMELCSAFNSFKESTSVLYESDSRQKAQNFGNRLRSVYQEIVYEQSEMFWVDPYNYELTTQEIDGTFRVYVKPSYILEEKDALAKKERFEKKLETIVKNAKAKSTTFEKIRYVYDYILSNCSYDNELADEERFDTTAINAYGCLIEGKTICSGYTMAFDAIMKRLGFECGVEFNSYADFSIVTGHVWNYCKIEDDYYYFDLTWDDTAFDTDFFRQYFDGSYMYFGITREELAKTHIPLSTDAPTPRCNGTKYNFFVHEGYSFATYDFEAVKESILQQASQNYAMLRFDSYGQLLAAQSDLLDAGKINSIITDSSIQYVVSESGLHLYLFF